jgi:hypothetical protein
MLTYYMLKTNEHPYSQELANSVAIFNLSETIIDEAYSQQADALRNCGVRCIPSLIAVYEDESGKLTCIHEAATANELLGFQALAEEKLALFLGQ